MRSKALLLGVQPPFEGPWVPTSGVEAWDLVIQTLPTRVAVDGELTVLLMNEEGDVTPLPPGGRLNAMAMRAIVKEVEGVETISVYIEECKG